MKFLYKTLFLLIVVLTSDLMSQYITGYGKGAESETLFNEDFSTGTLDNWDFYRFSSGLHGAVPDPYIEAGRVNIITRDQQRTFLRGGNLNFSEYSVTAEARIEEAYDDANRQIIFFFYVLETGGEFQNYQDIKGFSFSISARDSRWYLTRHNYPVGANTLKTGTKTFSMGVSYKIELSPSSDGFDIYFYPSGAQRELLTSYSGVVQSEKRGYFGFGGGDDRISVDNISVSGLQLNFQNYLRAYYPLNGNSLDSSGNGQHGAGYSVSYTTDRFGNQNGAALFDGVNSEVIITPDSLLSSFASGDHSVSAWFRLSETTVSQKFIVDYGETTRDQEGLRIETGGKANFKWVTDPVSSNFLNGVTRLQPGHWYHILATVKGTKGKLYLNGVLVDSLDNGNLPNTVRFQKLKIGNISGGGLGGIKFKGAIDDVRLLNSALTDEEIKILFTEKGWSQNDHPFVKKLWNGTEWINGVLTGEWFPVIDSFAVFNQSSNTLTQLVSSETFTEAKKINIKIKPQLSVQGMAQGDAFLGIGSGLGEQGAHFTGIRFRDGRIQFYEKYYSDGVKDTSSEITLYEAGKWIEPEISKSLNGTVKIRLGENEYLYSPVINTGDYKIIIGGANALNGFDVSLVTTDTILTEKIQVADPDGGELLRGGTPYEIKWTSTGVGFVDIEYTTNGGSVWNSVVSNYKDTSFFLWPVPEISSGTVKLRIQKSGNPSVADTSNADFRIITPTLTLQRPNDGEIWKKGEAGLISWDGNDVDSVRIELSQVDLPGWQTIYESVAFTRDTLFFHVSEDFPDGEYKIKISDTRYEDVSDSSDSAFRIVRRLKIPEVTGISANDINDAAIFWNSFQDSSALGYIISRKPGDSLSAGLYKVVAVTGSGSESFTDTNLTLEGAVTKYTYKIQAFNDYDTSAISGQYTIVLKLPETTLFMPSDSLVNVPVITEFQWKKIKTGNPLKLIQYNLQISTDPGFQSLFKDTTITDTSNSVSLQDGRRYYWRVKTGLQNFFIDAPPIRSFTTGLRNPLGFMAELTSINDVNLSWMNSTLNADAHIIERKSGDSLSPDPWIEIATVPALQTAYTDREVLLTGAVTIYSYRLRSYNNADTSGYSSIREVRVGIATVEPVSPANFSRNLAQNITLNWKPIRTIVQGSVVNYNLVISGNSDFTGQSVCDTIVTDTSVTRMFEDGKSYFWKVKAIVNEGEGFYSSIRQFTTELKNPHSGYAVVKNINDVTLSWEDPTLNETGFMIQRKNGDSLSGNPYIRIGVVSANTTNFTDTSATFYELPSNYTYRVFAFNQADTSLPGNQIAVTLRLASVTLSFPEDEARKVAEVSEFRWEKLKTVSNSSLVWYNLQISESQSMTQPIYDITIPDTFKIVTLEDGKRYFWRVRPVVNGITGQQASVRSVYTKIRLPHFTASLVKNINDAELVWNDPTLNETGYILERKAGAPSEPNSGFQVIRLLPRNSTSVTDSNLVIKDSVSVFSYRIRSFSVFDTSSFSDTVSVTLGIETVSQLFPADLTLDSDESVTFVWKKIRTLTEGSPVYYHLQITEDSLNGNIYFSDSTLTDSMKTVILRDGKKYFWRIGALVNGGRGKFSAFRQLETDLNCISHLGFSAANINDITLSWVNDTINESGLLIQRHTGDSLSMNPWLNIFTALPGTTVFTDSSVPLYANPSLYSYRVIAFNETDTAFYGVRRQVTINLQTVSQIYPPDSSRNLPESFQVSWNRIRTETEGSGVLYELQVSEDPYFDSLIYHIQSPDTSHTLSFKDGIKYFWRVRAIVDSLKGYFSGIREFTTELRQPGTGFAEIKNINEVTLTWADATFNESGFIIERKTGDSLTGNSYAVIGVTSPNTTNFTDTNALFYELPSKYTYRISAYSPADTSLPGNQIGVTLRLAPVSLSAPADELRKVPEACEFRWERLTTVSNSSTVWYNLQISESQNMTSPVYDVTITDTFKLVTVEDGKKYYWRVRPLVNGITGEQAAVRSFYSIIRVPQLTASSVKNINDVELVWNDPTPNETGFIVERKKGLPSDTLEGYQPVIITASNVTSVTDTALALSGISSTFSYRVRSFSEYDTSAASTETSVTIGIETAAQILPENFVFDSEEEVTFVWKKIRTMSEGSTVYYHLEITQDSLAGNIYFSDSTLTDTMKTVILQDGKRYVWRVRALVNGGSGNFSTLREIETDLNCISGLNFSASNINDITLNWVNNTINESGLIIQRRMGDSLGINYWDNLAILTPGTSSFSDTNLRVYANPARYVYRVIAFNVTDTASFGMQKEVTVKLQSVNQVFPPDSSGNLPESFTFSWERIKTETEGSVVYYELQVSESALFDSLTNRIESADSSQLLQFADGRRYFWRVRAIVDSVYSDSGSVRSFVTQLRNPEELKDSLGNINDIFLSWGDISENETSFIIERKNGDTASAAPYEVRAVVPANTTQWTDSSAAFTGINTSYTYRVWAANAIDTSLSSNETVSSMSIMTVNPILPSDQTKILPDSIRFTWNRIGTMAEGSVVYYQLQIAEDSMFTSLIFNDSTITDTARHITLEDGKLYFWRVRAEVTGVDGLYMIPRNFITRLRVPSGVNSNITNLNDVNLRWNELSVNETNYVIERKTGDAGSVSPYQVIAVLDQNTGSFTDSNLVISQIMNRYTYRIKCLNGTDTSYYSTQHTATVGIQRIELSQPANFERNIPFTTSLKWIKLKSVGEAIDPVYHLQISNNISFSELVYDDSTLTDTMKTITLEDGIKLYWRVRAKANNVYGQYSNTWNFTTDLHAVNDLQCSPVNLRRTELHWSDVTDHNTGYFVERRTGDSTSLSPFLLLAALPQNATSFIDTSFILYSMNSVFTYRVRSYNSLDTSNSSNHSYANISLLTPEPVTPPDSSRGIPVLVSFGWKSMMDNAVQTEPEGFRNGPKLRDFAASEIETPELLYNFRLMRDSLNGFTAADTILADTTVVIKISDGRKYFWQVRAKMNVFGNFCEPFMFTSKLNSPDSLRADTTQSYHIRLTWYDRSSNEEHFILERKTGDLNSTSPYEVITVTDSAVTEYVDRNVAGGGQYYTYRVRAVNILDSSDYSAAASVRIITGIGTDDVIPVSYDLSQNFPNPFNPSTILRFALPEESNVRLIIYNMMGEAVAVPCEGPMKAGYYEYRFDAGSLASGAYIYRMTAESIAGNNSFYSVKKMLLIK